MDTDLRTPLPPRHPRAAVRWAWRLVRDVVREYGDDGVGDLAAAITFWTILSIPAAVLALVSALSSLESVAGESVTDDVRREIDRFVTDTLIDAGPLQDTIDELFTTSSPGLATVATVIAVFTLSRAFAGLIRALDQAYEVEDSRPFWYVRIVAIGLGVGTIAIVAAGATLLALVPDLPLGAVRWLTPPLVVSALVLWAATIFHIGPNHRTPWRYDLPGAILTAFGWVASSQLFAVYVRIAGTGNSVQTSIAGVLLALTLLYVLSIVLLLGAELNDVIARRAGVVDAVAPVGQRARRARHWATSTGTRLLDAIGPNDDDADRATRDPQDPNDDDAADSGTPGHRAR